MSELLFRSTLYALIFLYPLLLWNVMRSEHIFTQNEGYTGHTKFTRKFSTSTIIQNFTKTYEHYSYRQNLQMWYPGCGVFWNSSKSSIKVRPHYSSATSSRLNKAHSTHSTRNNIIKFKHNCYMVSNWIPLLVSTWKGYSSWKKTSSFKHVA